MKYSINSSGYIVAERDIYSLGGFIPKGSVGCKVANGDQISQDGECWVAGGDISARPDVRVKDNAYIGDFLGSSTDVHTDGITEFSGNSLIPGKIIVRNLIAGPVSNFFAKDSFIGVSMDILCGQEADTTAFPFEQGGFNRGVPAGTLFTSASMRTDDANTCRTTANLCLGKDTYLYIPTGYNCRVFWGYRNTAGQLAYSGESFVPSQALTKLEHPTYKLAMVHITKVNGTAMTPTDLLATGAKILGHISGSVNVDIRPESASGSYVMDNSSFIVKTSNFGLATTQLRFLAGGLFDSTMYTLDDRADYRVYGTFHNVQRLEYAMSLSDSHKTNVNRDRYISAYDCPLLRVDDTTYNDALAAKGDLVLRRCIVPKASFSHDSINGNTYEDIDFSYTNDFIRQVVAGRNLYSSHREGLYACESNGNLLGLISYPGNVDNTARISENFDYIPLDGDIMEQGTYTATVGQFYEDGKGTASVRVRTGKPVSTDGLTLPTVPAGFIVSAAYYLDKDFKFAYSVAAPTSINMGYPYVVMVFKKDDDSAINITDFIALGVSLRQSNYNKVPEITGSAYVGAGCTVRGDVKLIGDPYVNRVFDVNMWERGENTMVPQQTWEAGKNLTNQERHFEIKNTVPVESGGTVSAGSGYFLYAGWLDENGLISGTSGVWAASFTVPANAKYVGLVLKKAASAETTGVLIEDSDIPLANVKYVRAFKKRRYIVNELDRTSPEDILLSVDYWEQGGLSIAESNAGKPYEELKISTLYRIRLKRPFGLGQGYRVTFQSGYSLGTTYYDAATKLLFGSTSVNMNNALFALVGGVADSPTAPITPADVTATRLIVDFTPSPRIVAPYGVSNVWIDGTKVRMYDNSVISRTITKGAGVILKGDAVMGSVFTGDVCMCSNGHGDAIINK